MNSYTTNDDQITIDILQNQINTLKMQNDSKDEYIRKLEEKTVMMQTYIVQLEKENMTKAELGKNIIKTKEEFDKLRLALGEKYSKLEIKYEKLKARCSHTTHNNNNNNYPNTECHMTVPNVNHNSTVSNNINTNYPNEKRGHNAKIDKCIEKINNLVTEMNK